MRNFLCVLMIFVLVLQRDQIIAMCFAGPLGLFQQERGVNEDPYRDDPDTAYMLDLTVAESHRGRLGALMKQALLKLAMASGVTAIHGRNRDRMAAGMWAINLSLGSYPTQYLVDDYPDQQPFRDCIYYRCPTTWTEPKLDLSSGVEAPLGVQDLDGDAPLVLAPAMLSAEFVDAPLHGFFIRRGGH